MARHGQGEDPKANTASVDSNSRQGRLQKALEGIYGAGNVTPQMMSEAQNWLTTNMTGIGAQDMEWNTAGSNAYQNQQFANFLGQLQANPTIAGQANSSAFGKIQSDKANAELAARMAPGSTLYNQYFGTGGILPAQEEAYKSSMTSKQAEDTKNRTEALAARGLSTSGAVGANISDIDKSYADAMSQAFQNMQAQGLQNLTSQAQQNQNWSNQQQAAGLQQVGQSISDQQQQAEAKKLESAKNAASGWSWLTPVATAIGGMIPGIGAIAGPALGAATSALTQSQPYTLGSGGSNFKPSQPNTPYSLETPSFQTPQIGSSYFNNSF